MGALAWSSCTLGDTMRSHTFCRTSADEKRLWWTESETVVKNRIAVVTSRS